LATPPIAKDDFPHSHSTEVPGRETLTAAHVIVNYVAWELHATHAAQLAASTASASTAKAIHIYFNFYPTTQVDEDMTFSARRLEIAGVPHRAR